MCEQSILLCTNSRTRARSADLEAPRLGNCAIWRCTNSEHAENSSSVSQRRKRKRYFLTSCCHPSLTPNLSSKDFIMRWNKHRNTLALGNCWPAQHAARNCGFMALQPSTKKTRMLRYWGTNLGNATEKSQRNTSPFWLPTKARMMQMLWPFPSIPMALNPSVDDVTPCMQSICTTCG